MVSSRKKKGNTPHYHGCRRCHHVYEDACDAKTENGLCVFCRGGNGWQLLRDNRSPKPCCRVSARMPTKDERVSYRLAGNSLWFICDTCKRSQPYDDPKRTSNE